LWAVVGLVPAVMFVTGLLMWWNRVVRKRRSVSEQVVAEPAWVETVRQNPSSGALT
jgi:uncharacterized iron-regulated membrane protein